jgi:hypothetical protein
MGRQLTLRQAQTGQSASFNEDLIIFVEDDTLGSQVEYLEEEGGIPRSDVFVNTRPQIQAMSTCIIPVSLSGKTAGMNINRMTEIEETSTGCKILYDVSGMIARPKNTTDSYETIQTRIYEKQGLTVYTFDAVNATNNTISLAASFGDLTSTFAATKVMDVFGSGDEDFDGMYTISSSTFSGGKTVITVIQNIPSGVATSGSLILGATT